MRGIYLLMVPVLLTFTLLGCLQSEPERVYLQWDKVDLDKTQIRIDISFDNAVLSFLSPNFAEARLYANGIQIAREKSFQVSGNSIEVVMELDNRNIIEWWVSHVRNNETTDIVLKSSFGYNLFGLKFSVPVEKKGSFKTSIFEINSFPEYVSVGSMRVLKIEKMKMNIVDVDKENTRIRLDVSVKNLTPFPIPIGSIGYRIDMNGIEMGYGKSTGNKIIKSYGSSDINWIIVIDNSKLPWWWVSHIKNGEITDITINAFLNLEIAKKGYEISIFKHEVKMQTSFLEMVEKAMLK